MNNLITCWICCSFIINFCFIQTMGFSSEMNSWLEIRSSTIGKESLGTGGSGASIQCIAVKYYIKMFLKISKKNLIANYLYYQTLMHINVHDVYTWEKYCYIINTWSLKTCQEKKHWNEFNSLNLLSTTSVLFYVYKVLLVTT